MKVRAGTSGYSYKEWKGTFYPAKLSAAGMLPFYAERFSTVEINNTFYRMPSESVLLNWAAQVPDGFAFVLKAPRRITHDKRLKNADEDVSYLLKTAAGPGEEAGPSAVSDAALPSERPCLLAGFSRLTIGRWAIGV